MKTVSELMNFVGKSVDLQCRVTLLSNSPSDTAMEVLLEDMTGELVCRVPRSEYKGPFSFPAQMRAQVNLIIERGRHTFTAHVNSLKPLARLAPQPVRTVPRAWCPRPELLLDLHKLVESINFIPLAWFVEDVLNDQSLLRKFITIPASEHHHHSEECGLLIHSLQCVRFVDRWIKDDATMRDIAIVAALFHDLGKVGEYHRGIRLPRNLRSDHRDTTLELLSSHLARLETLEWETADALRYIFSLHQQDKSEQSRPKLPIALIVRAADQFSAASDAEKRAFRNSPKGKTLVSLRCPGPRNAFFRPKVALGTLHKTNSKAKYTN